MGALLSYVEEVNAGGDVKDGTFAELKRRFTPEEILELTIVTVHYYGTGLLTRSLQLKPEEDEPLLIGPRRLCRSKAQTKSPAARQGFSAIGLLGGALGSATRECHLWGQRQLIRIRKVVTKFCQTRERTFRGAHRPAVRRDARDRRKRRSHRRRGRA